MYVLYVLFSSVSTIVIVMVAIFANKRARDDYSIGDGNGYGNRNRNENDPFKQFRFYVAELDLVLQVAEEGEESG